MTEYNIKAIPTMYNGVQFRSRLEATWAAFFDLCGWDWDYEPIDLNGWIPDFVLKGVSYNIYVEVKPFTNLDQFDDVIIKICKTGIDENILLLGLSPNEYELGFCNDDWLGDKMQNYEIAMFSDHELYGNNKYSTQFKYRYDYYNRINSYDQRLNDMYDGDHYNDNSNPMPLWKQAKNKVQWKPKTS
jgi:hypothetical protein